MSARTGICSNFGLCSKADTREAITGPAAGDFSCPECGRPLTARGGGGGGSASGAGGGGGGSKKGIFAAIGAAVVLIGGLFTFLVWPDSGDPQNKDGKDSGVVQPVNPPTVDPLAPVNPPAQDPSLPPQETVIQPPTQGGQGTDPGNAPAPRQVPARQQPPPQQQRNLPPKQQPASGGGNIKPQPAEKEPTSPPPTTAATTFSATTLHAKLLSPISTRQSHEGDQFTARVEGGKYNGAILTGHITKLEKKKKESRIAFQFETITLNGAQIPIKADLKEITNAQGLKGVDEEGHAISTSSKKKAFMLGAIGGVVGGVWGKIKGGGKGAAIGAGAGAATGMILGLTVVGHASELHMAPGTILTLDTTEASRS